MDIVIINIISTIFFVLIYLSECVHSKSYVNVFTPFFIIALPSHFTLDLFYILIIGPAGEPTSYAIVYATYLIEFAGLVLGYRVVRRSVVIRVQLFNQSVINFSFVWFLLALSILLYLPILAKYSELLLSPRDIYTKTRTGGGAFFFLSITVGYLSFIAFLFVNKKKIIQSVLYLLLLFISLLLHGNKSPLVILLFIYLLYLVLIENKKISAINAIKYSAILSLMIVVLFYVTFSAGMKENFMLGIASYADYNRNYIKVIESNLEVQYGKLTIENNFVSLLPRALFPDKPKNFGTFYLAQYFYPEWFDADTGSPAFGFGVQYADFRGFSLIYILLTSILIGCLLKIFMNRVRKYGSPADFILVLFFCGISLLELGAGYMLLPHVVIAILFSFTIAVLKQINKKMKKESYLVSFDKNVGV